jgi:predicted kinase
MPERRRLSTLVTQQSEVDDDLRELARLLAVLHARSERRPEIDREGGVRRLRERWVDNLDAVRPFHGHVVDARDGEEVERLSLRYLDGRGQLLDARVRRGAVVDGHGDLTAEDVFCLEDGPRALDCLEFDAGLRYVDRIDDAAFLAMDLERLGARALGTRFMGWYTEFAGDWAPPSLVHHYIAYRAFVRVKVACLQHAQGDGRAAGEVRRLVSITRRHLADAAVTLTLVGGLPGTGKSTLAGALADRFGMVVLNTDRVRKELAGLGPGVRASSGYREGIYTSAWSDRTYDEVLTRAGALLELGESVVLDASWAGARHREAARALAQRTSSDVVELCCRAPRSVAEARLSGRDGPSDADAGIAAAMAGDAEPWTEAVDVDTAGKPEVALLEVMDLYASGRTPPEWRPRSLMEPD